MNNLPIRSVYEIGVAIHQKIVAKGIWQVGDDKEKFQRIWGEARDEVLERYKNDPGVNKITWTLDWET